MFCEERVVRAGGRSPEAAPEAWNNLEYISKRRLTRRCLSESVGAIISRAGDLKMEKRFFQHLFAEHETAPELIKKKKKKGLAFHPSTPGRKFLILRRFILRGPDPAHPESVATPVGFTVAQRTLRNRICKTIFLLSDLGHHEILWYPSFYWIRLKLRA